MVAPSLTLADSHSTDGHIRLSVDTSSKAASEKHNHDAICLVTPASIDSSSEEGRHENNYCNGHIKHGTRVIKEPQSNSEECGIYGIKEHKEPKSNDNKFGPWESNAMYQEPTTKFISGAHDMGTAQQPKNSTEPITFASINAGCAPKGKRVQWSDNHGKELVHVFEYGVSDTEEDEDNTDTCTCTIQ